MKNYAKSTVIRMIANNVKNRVEFTMNPRCTNDLDNGVVLRDTPDFGFVVSILDLRAWPNKPINGYGDKHLKGLVSFRLNYASNHDLLLGGWNGDDGYYLDANKHVSGLEVACNLAVENNQLAIWDARMNEAFTLREHDTDEYPQFRDLASKYLLDRSGDVYTVSSDMNVFKTIHPIAVAVKESSPERAILRAANYKGVNPMYLKVEKM